MDVVEFKADHYPELVKLWVSHDWVAPGLDILPRKGYVVLSAGKPCAAAFVYRSCSGMALLDWVIADAESTPLSRGKGVYLAIGACRAYATREGFKVLYTVTANAPLLETYRRMGFSDMEKNATTMAISLTGQPLDFLKE